MKAGQIIGAVQGVTKKWAKQRKREERERSAVLNRRVAMTRRPHVSIRTAAWQIMEQAYLKASAAGTLPAHARQIMYAARAYIQKYADRELGQNFDTYFTQQLLPDYIDENGVDWNVIFDARGHFHEPHTGLTVPLGTLEVRNYLSAIEGHKVEELKSDIGRRPYPTLGPKNRYGGCMFIEKEGFTPLFREVKLAERHDLAVMSTKGMSVTASRKLVDELAAHNIPLFVLHDFDKSGFSMVGTFRRDNRRYSYENNVDVIDLGILMADIEGLETEEVYLERSAAANLRENGATDEEIEFLMRQRVELNAFPSDKLIAWIERKLEEHGVKKVVPDDDTLAAAYRRAHRQIEIQKRIDEIITASSADIPVPADLRARVEARLRERPEARWDGAVRGIVVGDGDNGGAE